MIFSHFFYFNTSSISYFIIFSVLENIIDFSENPGTLMSLVFRTNRNKNNKEFCGFN